MARSPTTHAPLGLDFFYQVTVTNFTNSTYTLTGSDPLCDTPGDDAFEAPGEFSNPQELAAMGTVVCVCEIDAIAGADISGDSIPMDATAGAGPYPLTNSVTITATPDAGGTPVTLTDSITANFN